MLFYVLISFLIIIWPVVIPIVFSFIYGLKTKIVGSKRIIIWFLVVLPIAFLSALISLRLDEVLIPVLITVVICLPIMYLGVWIKKIKK